MSKRTPISLMAFHHVTSGAQRALVMKGWDIPVVGDLLELGMTDQNNEMPWTLVRVTHVETISESTKKGALAVPDRVAMVSFNKGHGFD